jgi:hypothetical protein
MSLLKARCAEGNSFSSDPRSRSFAVIWRVKRIQDAILDQKMDLVHAHPKQCGCFFRREQHAGQRNSWT